MYGRLPVSELRNSPTPAEGRSRSGSDQKSMPPADIGAA
ncbi:hypothetical protein PY32053_01962 [Paracoccus yeei]|uniref:Uncharacterized protein n=1 Tax=Paracoccus yeei TaxID=147645 RepID=A0A386UMC2_9RHOB|nr:hypothetical protein PY32053_01962 [Paracoccus yeei]